MKTPALNLRNQLTICMQLLAAMLFLIFTHAATAQTKDTLPTPKPDKRWGIGVMVGLPHYYVDTELFYSEPYYASGNTKNISLAYNLKLLLYAKNTTYNLRVGITPYRNFYNYNSFDSSIPATNNQITNSTLKQNSYFLGIGISKKIFDEKKWAFNIGGELGYTFFSKIHDSRITDYYDTLHNYKYSTVTNYDLMPIQATVLNLKVEILYKISKSINIGFDLYSGLQYLFGKGNTTNTSYSIPQGYIPNYHQSQKSSISKIDYFKPQLFLSLTKSF